jgi:hypothetical protein
MIAEALNALLEALLTSNKTRPLGILARPRYPLRELSPQMRPDGSLMLSVHKYGCEYKHRGRRLKNPPPADTEAMQAELNESFQPHGLYVVAVRDCGRYVEIEVVE